MTDGPVGEQPPAAGGETDVDGAARGGGVGPRTLVALSKLGLALREQSWRDAGPRGLNPTQTQSLMTLARVGTEGARLSTVAEHLGVSAPTASDSLAALAKKGLVRKTRDPADRRARVLTLTEEGRRVAGELAEWPDLLLESVDVLSAEEEGILLRSLLKMIRELQVRGRIAPSRMCVTCRYFRPGVHDNPEAPHHCEFVDLPFGDRELRVDCTDHDERNRPA